LKALHDADPHSHFDKACDDGTPDAGATARYQRHLSVEPAHDPALLSSGPD
jgi:hypothetical protein